MKHQKARIGHLHAEGTRVRLYPEYAAGYREPEVVHLSPPPGSVGIGPSDSHFVVANARDKRKPYHAPADMPPYRGPVFAPASPDADGHFDHIPVDRPEFLAVHAWGCARFALDIWEHYLGRPIAWWHAPEVPRLEIVPVVHWRNAHSGPGFLETGIIDDHEGRPQLFCLNFDVIAHEIGHATVFAELGAPASGCMSAAYLAFHESYADLFGMIGALRFASVARKLLAQTHGNLYVLNLVSRIGAYSETEQIRIASNEATMADVADIRLEEDGSWTDPTGQDRNQHAISAPLTGAIFDVFVEIYQDRLAQRGVIPPDADARGWTRAEVAAAMHRFETASAGALASFEPEFDRALIEARDVIGLGMAHVLRTLHPDTLSFDRVAARMLEAAWGLGEQAPMPALLGHFLRRGIDPRPFLRRTGRGGRETLAFVDSDPASQVARTRDPRDFLEARHRMRHEHREGER